MTVTEAARGPAAGDDPEAPSLLEVDLDDAARRLARAAVAWVIAILVGVALTPHVPGGLPSTSDVAGYPMAFGFDSLRYRNVYAMWVIGVPLLALALHRALLRLTPGTGAHRTTIGIVPAYPADHERFTRASSVGRATLLGLLGGLQAAIVAARWGWNPWTLTALGVVAGFGVGWAATDRRTPSATSGYVHLAMATCGIFGMYGVSRSVWAVVGPDRVPIGYSVLPFALVVVVAVSFVGIAVTVARRSDAGWSALERGIGWYLTPVLLLLTITTQLPGVASAPDLFHDGERLGGAQFLLDGATPWRDFISIHGLLYDALYPLLGLELIDSSHWGVRAVYPLIITPVYYASLYLLLAVLLRKNWLLLGTCFVLLVVASTPGYPFFVPVHDRLVLLFPSLIAMIWFLRTPRVFPASVFMLLLFSQTILTPESAYMVPAAAIVIVLADLQDRRAKGEPIRTRFVRTFLFVVTGCVATLAFALALVAFGAFNGFVEAITTFAPDHYLTGAFPIMWGGFIFAIAAYTPPIAIVCMFSLCWLRKARGQMLSASDLAMLTLALFLLPYYTKFLYRADGHVYQPFSMSLPLAVYLIYRAIEAIDGAAAAAGLRRLGGIRTQTLLAVPIAVAALFPWTPALRAIESNVTDAATSIQPEVATVSLDPKLGYSASTLDQVALPDLQHLFTETAGRSLTVFDFTNSPGLYEYFLDVDTTTRFYHVSMAIREKTQRTLIDELEDDPPDVVVLQGSLGGLSGWDNLPNIVRHYDVSEWIQRNYRPWMTLHTQVLYQRADLSLPVGTAAQLGLRAEPSVPDPIGDIAECSFRQLGERLPVDRIDAWTDVPTEPADEMVTVAGWAGRPAQQAQHVIVLDGDSVVAVTVPSAPDPSFSSSLDLAPETLVAFNVVVPSVRDSRDELWVAATFADGTVSAVTQPPESVLQDRGATLTLVDRSVYRWAPGSVGVATLTSAPAAADGTVTLADGTQASIDRVRLPADAVDNSWLSVSSDDSLAADTFILADRLDSPMRLITFDSLGDASVDIQIGACPQWHARRTEWMYLVHHQPASNPVTVRLGKADVFDD